MSRETRSMSFNRRSLMKASAGAAATGGLMGFDPRLIVAQDATPDGAAIQGGNFRTGAAQHATSFHPYLNTDTASFSSVDLVNWLPPLRYNPENMELEPFAAESFEQSDDFTQVTFSLK